jgi:septation ring formation regulator EzrA
MNSKNIPEMKSDFNNIAEFIAKMYYESEEKEVYQDIVERAYSIAVAYKRKYEAHMELCKEVKPVTTEPKKAPRYDMDDDGFSEELQAFDVLSEFVKDEKVRDAINTSELNKEFREWVDAIPDSLWNQKRFYEEWIFYVRDFLKHKYGRGY